MAFPSLGSGQQNLSDAWDLARSLAAQTKNAAQNLLTAIQAGPVSGLTIAAYPGQLYSAYSQLQTIAAISGIGAYAQAQMNSSENVSADFTAMINAMVACWTWVTTNFPKDSNGNLLFAQFNANGQFTYTTFTSAQLAGLVTDLQALIATIS